MHAALFGGSGTTVTRTDLGTLGGSATCALAINNGGQIAGYSLTHNSEFVVSNVDAVSEPVAWVWLGLGAGGLLFVEWRHSRQKTA